MSSMRQLMKQAQEIQGRMQQVQQDLAALGRAQAQRVPRTGDRRSLCTRLKRPTVDSRSSASEVTSRAYCRTIGSMPMSMKGASVTGPTVFALVPLLDEAYEFEVYPPGTVSLADVVDGRLPSGDHEIMLSAATMRSIGAQPGGLVRVIVTLFKMRFGSSVGAPCRFSTARLTASSGVLQSPRGCDIATPAR